MSVTPLGVGGRRGIARHWGYGGCMHLVQFHCEQGAGNALIYKGL